MLQWLPAGSEIPEETGARFAAGQVRSLGLLAVRLSMAARVVTRKLSFPTESPLPDFQCKTDAFVGRGLVSKAG